MGARDDGDGEDGNRLKSNDPLLPILQQLASTAEQSPAAPQYRRGDRMGKFEVLREVGHGGFGVVYEARDRDLGRHVALKVMAGAGGAGVEQALAPLFKREAETAARLNHPNIVTLFDFGVFEGLPYLVLELLEGETVQQRLARGPIPEAEATRILVRVVRALVHAHRAGVIHRDLKPSNVFVTTEGAVKVLDLGLARLLEAVAQMRSTMLPGSMPDSVTRPTLSGAGTPAYMAPEQWRGEPGDARSDIFSAGVTLYEMLTGALPFDLVGRGKAAVLDDAPAPPITTVSANLAAVVAKAIAKSPEERFQSAQELLDALPRTPARRTKHLGLIALGAAAMIAIGGVIAARHFRSAQAVPAASKPKPRRSVAVLGFKNLSGRPDVAWISTALAETLNTELAIGDELRTVPGERVARTKNDLSLGDSDGFEPATLLRLRQNLAADYVVLGSYLAIGSGQLRVDIRLQDTAAGETVVQASESGSDTDLPAVVTRVGGRLRQALRAGAAAASESLTARHALPANPEAARLYSEGLAKLRAFDPAAAKPLLEQAIAADPGSPLPHAALAQVFEDLGPSSRALAEAKLAFEHSGDQSREQRLFIEARYREISGANAQALALYQTLFDFYPDNLEYGLGLANALSRGRRVADSLRVIAMLRKLPPPLCDDPRIDFAEAGPAGLARHLEVAEAAARKGEAMGARLVVADARAWQAMGLWLTAEYERAIAAAEEAKRLYVAAGKNAGVLDAERIIIIVTQIRDADRSRTAARCDEFRALAERTGFNANAINWFQASISLDAGDVASAKRSLEQSKTLSEGREQDVSEDPFLLLSRGWLALETGNVAAAREPLQRRPLPALIATVFGDFLRIEDDLNAAHDFFVESIEHSKETAWPRAVLRAGLARVLVEQGHLAEAEAMARQSVETLRNTKTLMYQGLALAALARALLAQGKLSEAQNAVDQLASYAAATDNKFNRVDAIILGARVRAANQRAARSEAIQALAGAEREATRLELFELQLEARLARGQIEIAAGNASGRAHLAQLARDARKHGYNLIARLAEQR